MRFGIKSHYALLALVDVALYSKGKPVCLADVAARQKLPLAYLEQLFNQLKRRGLVLGSRGQKGGYTLREDAEAITISQIMEAIEEPLRITPCNGNQEQSCQGRELRCPLHNFWTELEGKIHTHLSDKTLADLCATPSFGSSVGLAVR